MTQAAAPAVRRQTDRAMAPGFALCVALLAALTFLRLGGLQLSIVDLYTDESQYWAWSRELAAGYFSKPPLLAWIIAGAEAVCGSGEACLRAPAPLFYLGTCLIVFAIARDLYDGRTAFWAALTMALTPGLVFSTRIISTDVPLLFFWALALFAYVRLLRGADWRWTLVLGLALGFGTLAKYAMAYFLLGIALAALIDAEARRLLRGPAVWIALLVMAAMIAPNLLWNAEHGFATFRHTGDNIRGGGVGLSPLKAAEFVVSQAAVIGPVAFGTLILMLARLRGETLARADRLLLAFAIPVLVLVTATALTSRAHANWAATAMVSAVIATAAFLVRQQAWRWLAASLAIGAFAQAALIAGDAFADRINAPFLRKGDLYERTMGWRGLGAEAARLADRNSAASIATEWRDDVAAITYYGRAAARPVLVWPAGAIPGNHYELNRRLTAAAAQPVLFVSRCPLPGRLAAGFASVEPAGEFAVRSGPTTGRRYFAFKLAGPLSALAPLAPCR